MSKFHPKLTKLTSIISTRLKFNCASKKKLSYLENKKIYVNILFIAMMSPSRTTELTKSNNTTYLLSYSNIGDNRRYMSYFVLKKLFVDFLFCFHLEIKVPAHGSVSLGNFFSLRLARTHHYYILKSGKKKIQYY